MSFPPHVWWLRASSLPGSLSWFGRSMTSANGALGVLVLPFALAAAALLAAALNAALDSKVRGGVSAAAGCTAPVQESARLLRQQRRILLRTDSLLWRLQRTLAAGRCVGGCEDARRPVAQHAPTVPHRVAGAAGGGGGGDAGGSGPGGCGGRLAHTPQGHLT